MSAALLDELLADFTAGPAKAANAANPQRRSGGQDDVCIGEALRTGAKDDAVAAIGEAGSQPFAAGSGCPNTPAAEVRRPPSQDSQHSQAHGPDGLDAQAARLLDLRARMLRWGWSPDDAQRQAERLVRRDRERDDDRVSCAECAHYRPGRCGNHRRAGLLVSDVGRDMATLLQRCPGYESR